jgi:hypothetical protein
MALAIDEVYLRIEHDVRPDGKGFVVLGDAEALAAEDIRGGTLRCYTDRWTTGYEAVTRADNLMMELLRLYLVANQIEIQSGLVYLER